MDSPDENLGVRLRPGFGVLLAILWNLPIVLLFWYPFWVFHLVMVGNCFLWSAGCNLAGRFQVCRALLFQPNPEGAPPRWRAAAFGMALLGTACLAAFFLSPW